MTAIITYIYPNALKYLNCFINELSLQTVKKFDLIIFNDGINNLAISKNEIKTSIIQLKGTPIEIRFKSFDILKNLDYENYIFIDIDDLMSENRIEIIIKKLKNNSIVCNDLNLMTENGVIIDQNVWKNRIVNNFSFNFNFIKNKNIIGFGNVGLKKSILKKQLKISNYPIVGDWFLFYQLLKINNIDCIFTSECQTNYRQHYENQVGLQKSSKKKWEHAVNVAQLHYKGLIDIGCEQFEPKFNLNYTELKLDNNFPFWWEEIEIIDEKN